jgi:hypothetical protein
MTLCKAASRELIEERASNYSSFVDQTVSDYYSPRSHNSYKALQRATDYQCYDRRDGGLVTAISDG